MECIKYCSNPREEVSILTMLLYALFLVTGVSCFQQRSAIQECADPDAFRCTNGECVHRYVWCDNTPDCSDGSDEDFCYGTSCLEIHFRCRNGGCIPLSGLCDSHSDCTDGSDEENCGATEWDVDTRILRPMFTQTRDPSKAVADAAAYFFSKMTYENGWGDFTPRAVVALSFADKVSPISKEEKELMVKQLNVQLMADLMQNRSEIPPSSLALYINALYATCQDPRNFKGRDLVKLLRSEVNNATQSNSPFPIALMTLCIADSTETGDVYRLAKMYSSTDRTGLKALVIMAMVCVARKTKHDTRNYVDNFKTINPFTGNADKYTKALYLQAAKAAGFYVDGELLTYQQPDGSFGDMLATYNAIPALLNTSLLDLRCNATKHEVMDVRNQLKVTNTTKKVIYSLWISTNTGLQTHSLVLQFEGNTTFYDIMRMAAARNPLYSFFYDQTVEGKKVYSLAGIPNDAETGKSWVLYEGDADKVTVNSRSYLRERTQGVDKIFPKDQKHFVFWLER